MRRIRPTTLRESQSAMSRSPISRVNRIASQRKKRRKTMTKASQRRAQSRSPAPRMTKNRPRRKKRMRPVKQ